MRVSPEKPSLPSVRDRAFTLVETAMALGIVAFVFTGLLGVMPIALTELGNARNNVVVAELAEVYLGKASQTDFSALKAEFGSGQTANTWHDISGVETTEDKALYKVVVSGTNASPYSQTMVVSVFRQPPGSANKALAEFVTVVPDNGR